MAAIPYWREPSGRRHGPAREDEQVEALPVDAQARMDQEQVEATRQLHIVRMFITGPNLGHVREVLVENRVTPDEIEVKRTEEGIAIDVEYVGLDKKHFALVDALGEIDGVKILLHY